MWPSSRPRLQVKSLIPAQSSKDFGKGQYICNFIPFFTSYNQFMYNVKNMTKPPGKPEGAGAAKNGGQFAIIRETDKAGSC